MPRSDASRKRCAIYTRKSSEEGLEQEFNSLQAQGEACEAYIRSQRHEGWALTRTRYDDGGFSGGNMERPALQRLLADIQGGRIDIIVVYKVDRLDPLARRFCPAGRDLRRPSLRRAVDGDRNPGHDPRRDGAAHLARAAQIGESGSAVYRVASGAAAVRPYSTRHRHSPAVAGLGWSAAG